MQRRVDFVRCLVCQLRAVQGIQDDRALGVAQSSRAWGIGCDSGGDGRPGKRQTPGLAMDAERVAGAAGRDERDR